MSNPLPPCVGRPQGQLVHGAMSVEAQQPGRSSFGRKRIVSKSHRQGGSVNCEKSVEHLVLPSGVEISVRRPSVPPEIWLSPIRPFERHALGQIFEQSKLPSWKVAYEARYDWHQRVPEQIHCRSRSRSIVAPVARVCANQNHSVYPVTVGRKSRHKPTNAVANHDSLGIGKGAREAIKRCNTVLAAPVFNRCDKTAQRARPGLSNSTVVVNEGWNTARSEELSEAIVVTHADTRTSVDERARGRCYLCRTRVRPQARGQRIAIRGWNDEITRRYLAPSERLFQGLPALQRVSRHAKASSFLNNRRIQHDRD